jgi:hypothetical protein
VSLLALPAATATVTYTATLAGRGRKGRTLRFAAATTSPDGATKRLSATVSIKR